MRYSLPDEDAREKAAGEAWPTRIERFKEAALSVSLAACWLSCACVSIASVSVTKVCIQSVVLTNCARLC